MAPERRMEGVVYRRGALTGTNFTPRPGKDTEASAGTQPGLSTEEALPEGLKGQRIDLGKLPPTLGAFADDPAEGGSAGHLTIVPVDSTGSADQQLLEEWAAAREAGTEHPLTQALLEAVVAKNVKGPA